MRDLDGMERGKNIKFPNRDIRKQYNRSRSNANDFVRPEISLISICPKTQIAKFYSVDLLCFPKLNSMKSTLNCPLIRVNTFD